MTDDQRTEQPAARAGRFGRVRAIARADVAPFLRGALTWLIRITVPLVTLNVLLRALPFRATVAGVPFRVQASLFTRQGLSADTTLGNWEFPRFRRAADRGAHLAGRRRRAAPEPGGQPRHRRPTSSSLRSASPTRCR